MKQADLVEFFLISVLLMCIVLFVKPDAFQHHNYLSGQIVYDTGE